MQQQVNRPAVVISSRLHPGISDAVTRSLPQTRRALEHTVLFAIVCALWALVLLSFLHGLA